MMFAEGLLNFGLTDSVFMAIRVIASLGGAIVGWFAADPLTRLVYRASFKGSAPIPVLLAGKGGGAAGLALLVYFMITFGGGGGLGFGPGLGGIPGKGAGHGGDKTANSDATKKDAANKEKDNNDATSKEKAIEQVEIEIISKKLFDQQKKDENRFYLIKRADKKETPPLTFDELEDFFKVNHAKIEVTPLMTRDSLGEEARDDHPLNQLIGVAKKYGVKTLQTKRP